MVEVVAVLMAAAGSLVVSAVQVVTPPQAALSVSVVTVMVSFVSAIAVMQTLRTQ